MARPKKGLEIGAAPTPAETLADESDTPENIDDALGESSWAVETEAARLAELRAKDAAIFDADEPGRGPFAEEIDRDHEAKWAASAPEVEPGLPERETVTYATGYDHKGESVDLPVSRPVADAQALTPADNVNTFGRLLLPGFEAIMTVDELVANISGRINLSYLSPADLQIWRSLNFGGRVVIHDLSVVVTGVAAKLALDKERQDKKRTIALSLRAFGFSATTELEPVEIEAGITKQIDNLANQARALLARPVVSREALVEFVETVAGVNGDRPVMCEDCGERGATWRDDVQGVYCDECGARASAALADGDD